jgi:hypothetical protein
MPATDTSTGTTPDGTVPATDGTVPTADATAGVAGDGTAAAGTDAALTDTMTDPAGLGGTLTDVSGGTTPTTDSTLDQTITSGQQGETVDTITSDTTGSTTPTTDTTTSSGGGDTTTTDPGTEPVGGGRSQVEYGSGSTWTWGIWETSGVMDGSWVNDSAVLSSADYQTLVTQSTTYNLTGSGVSEAIVEVGTTRNTLSGSCTMNVTIGNNVTPTWDGTFMLSGSGCTLDFGANGNIQSGGNLTGNPYYFTLQAAGVASPFGINHITSSDISGNLYGPLVGTPPNQKPSGVVGNYFFGCDNGVGTARVGGFFRSPLN